MTEVAPRQDELLGDATFVASGRHRPIRVLRCASAANSIRLRTAPRYSVYRLGPGVSNLTTNPPPQVNIRGESPPIKPPSPKLIGFSPTKPFVYIHRNVPGGRPPVAFFFLRVSIYTPTWPPFVRFGIRGTQTVYHVWVIATEEGRRQIPIFPNISAATRILGTLSLQKPPASPRSRPRK